MDGRPYKAPGQLYGRPRLAEAAPASGGQFFPQPPAVIYHLPWLRTEFRRCMVAAPGTAFPSHPEPAADVAAPIEAEV